MSGTFPASDVGSAISPKVSWSLLQGKGIQSHGPGTEVLTAGHRACGDTNKVDVAPAFEAP